MQFYKKPVIKLYILIALASFTLGWAFPKEENSVIAGIGTRTEYAFSYSGFFFVLFWGLLFLSAGEWLWKKRKQRKEATVAVAEAQNGYMARVKLYTLLALLSCNIGWIAPRKTNVWVDGATTRFDQAFNYGLFSVSLLISLGICFVAELLIEARKKRKASLL